MQSGEVVIRIPREALAQAREPSRYYTPEDNPMGGRKAWNELCRRAHVNGDFKVVKLNRRWLAWRDSFDAWLDRISAKPADPFDSVFAGLPVKRASRRVSDRP